MSAFGHAALHRKAASTGSAQPAMQRSRVVLRPYITTKRRSQQLKEAATRHPCLAQAVEAPERIRAATAPALSTVYMAAASSRGLRHTMEDYHSLAALHPELGVRKGRGVVNVADQQVALAAVFDGHAGQGTAATAAEYLPHILHQVLTGQQPASEDVPAVLKAAPLEPPTALSASMRSFDTWWASRRGRDRSGSTAVVGMVHGQELTVGNLGDSVGLLARGGSCQRLTVDHRADNAAEMLRVLTAGGELDYDQYGTLRLYRPSDANRRNGCMFTRSLGDFNFKQPQPLLLCEPHVVQQQLCPADSLLVLASDGVTDALPDDDVMEVATRAMEQARNKTDDAQQLAQAAATEVMIAALEHNSSDNITAVAMVLDWS